MRISAIRCMQVPLNFIARAKWGFLLGFDFVTLAVFPKSCGQHFPCTHLETKAQEKQRFTCPVLMHGIQQIFSELGPFDDRQMCVWQFHSRMDDQRCGIIQSFLRAFVSWRELPSRFGPKTIILVTFASDRTLLNITAWKLTANCCAGMGRKAIRDHYLSLSPFRSASIFEQGRL